MAATVRPFTPEPQVPGKGNAKLSEGLPLHYWADLGEVAPPDRLVKRLLGENSLGLVFGEPGCGKTFLATDMGLHIAMGRPWFGRAVAAGAVLYLAGEGIAGIDNRLAGFKLRHEVNADVPFAVVPTAVNLGPDGRDADGVIEAAGKLEAHHGVGVKLVIVDTLARNMGAGDENAARDMGAFIASCDRVRLGTGAAVLIVHHSGKNSQNGARGSSALLAAVDTAIAVEKSDKGRFAIVQKQKDGADGEEFGFALDVIEIGQDESGDPITTCTVEPLSDSARLKPNPRPPAGKAGVVFHALHRAIEEAGEVAPGSAHIPASVRVVSPDRWRQYAYNMMSESTSDARKKAFGRAHDSLLNKGLIGVWGSFVWIAQAGVRT
jgi:hypothetical protein